MRQHRCRPSRAGSSVRLLTPPAALSAEAVASPLASRSCRGRERARPFPPDCRKTGSGTVKVKYETRLARALVLLALCAAVEPALSAEVPTLDEVEVKAGAEDLVGTAGSASEGTVGANRLETRPLLRPGEVLETVPGVIVTQHSGDGKANQYFLRGFNLDHGTDFATFVNGVPVNMPSHAHGQGYSDGNF